MTTNLKRYLPTTPIPMLPGDLIELIRLARKAKGRITGDAHRWIGRQADQVGSDTTHVGDLSMLIQIAEYGDLDQSEADWLHELGLRIELKAIEARR